MKANLYPYLLILTLLSVWSVPAAAIIQGGEVIPESPTEGDSIIVRGHGYLPNSCYDINTHSESRQNMTIHLKIYTSAEGEFCGPVVQPYTLEWSADSLAVGSYTVQISEYLWGAGEGYGLADSETFSFDVATRTPVDRSTWGRIKRQY